MMHPLRCETCQHYIGDSKERYGVCNIDNHQVTKTSYLISESVGCASHSSAPVPEGYIITGVEISAAENKLFSFRERKKEWVETILSRPYNEQSIRQDEREKYEEQIKEWATTGMNKNVKKIPVQSLLFYLAELRKQEQP